jgi:hypothetical protein
MLKIFLKKEQKTEVARQQEQHVQKLRGENEAGRFKNKEEDSVLVAY